MNNCSGIIQALRPAGTCVLCGAETARRLAVCAACRRDLPRIGEACLSCGVPLPKGGRCPACQVRPPPYERTYAPLLYASPARELVLRFKFEARLSLSRLFAELVCERVTGGGEPLPELLLPVPLHRRRLRQRGFNQAVELGRLISGRLGLRARTDLLCRARDTHPQSRAGGARERRANVRGAFRLDGELDARHVAILDDVITTGSTVLELARIIRSAGARRVDVWAVCRAERSP